MICRHVKKVREMSRSELRNARMHMVGDISWPKKLRNKISGIDFENQKKKRFEASCSVHHP